MLEKEVGNVSIILYTFPAQMEPRKKVKFLRDFFGHRLTKNGKKYSYKGILDTLGGQKISNNVFMVPNSQINIVKAYLETYEVSYVVK